MERTTVENLKELIRAGRAKTPATKVIVGGTLVWDTDPEQTI